MSNPATPTTHPVEAPEKIVTMTIYVPISIRRRARMAAGGDDVSMSFWAADAIQRKLDAEDVK